MKIITMDKLGTVLLLAMAVSHSMAETHHLFTSSISTPHLFALQFDDRTNTLINVANMSAHDGHPWISFSYDKSTVYAGERTGFASYTVLNNTALAFSNSVSLPASCSGSSPDGTGSPYVLAELKAPFTVFGASSSSCGAVMSVDVAGNLQNVLQSFKFREGSSVKGMALDPDNKYLFSADERSNGIWTHSVTNQGTVTQISFTASPGSNRGPRRLVVHPSGKYLYAVMGQSNTVALFAINNGIGSDKSPLSYTGLSYSLLPRGATTSLYMADEVLLSADANVLFATTRYVDAPPEPPKQPKPTPVPNPTSVRPYPTQTPDYDYDDDDERRFGVNQKTTTKRAPQPGYITAILLTAMVEDENPLERRLVGAGFPIRPLFQLATTTSGGLSNSVSPAPWGNDFFALADSEVGLIEIWKLENLVQANYSGPLGEGASSRANGGWVQQSWSPRGTLVTPEVQDPNKPTPAPQPVYSPPPNNPWTWESQDPWQQSGRGTGDRDDDRGDRRSGKGGRNWRPRPSGDDSDSQDGDGEDRGFDDDRKRRFSAKMSAKWKSQPAEQTKSNIARARIYSRQFSNTTTLAVTARVVASWHAPIVPKLGRTIVEENTQVDPISTRRKNVNLKKPNGDKKQGKITTVIPAGSPPAGEAPVIQPPVLAPSNHEEGLGALEPVAVPPPNQQGIVMTEAEEKMAAAAGKSCCANALWFD